MHITTDLPGVTGKNERKGVRERAFQKTESLYNMKCCSWSPLPVSPSS